MVFDVRKDKEKKEDLCKLFGIEYDCYSKYLKNLTYKELNSKITYIISEGMSVFVNNRLNPIFFMSDINLQAAYGISKKEMINNYFKDYDARVKKNVLE